MHNLKLRLHNTLSHTKEFFIPKEEGKVSMYVCGPTVYNYAHIGNARPAVIFDLLYRLLQVLYPVVVYARNITDIDDKIMLKAEQENVSTETIAQRYYERYTEDMKSLHVLPPTFEPWATKHISEIQKIISKLLQKKHAYEAEGHVLFHVPSFKDYGHLSKRTKEDLIMGARVEIAPYKKDPSDFILWKPSHEKQIGWESPWGRGRPGWHIECSAMIHAIFNDYSDIHGGGIDLVFPHHENEIAQSSCFHEQGVSCAKYWLHNGFIRMDNEKMSKSIGNVSLVRELLTKHHGETLRLTLLATHYRSPLDWTEENIKQSKAILNRFYEALNRVESKTYEEIQKRIFDEAETKSETQENLKKEIQSKTWYLNKNFLPKKFLFALCDDLNTSEALACMHEICNQLNKSEKGEVQIQLATELLACGSLLGLLNKNPREWFQGTLKENQNSESQNSASLITQAEIEGYIKEREMARNEKNFKRADEIRTILSDRGVLLKDGDGGTQWYRNQHN